MKVTANLAIQIIKAGMPGNNQQSVNEIGGSIRCIDTAGKWFDLEWFHGESVVTTCNLEKSPNIWIGASESSTVTL
ncbi:hypothetical protein P7_148 [Pectobacterium phage vB_PcaM_P7_Pc]|nr:hypothetical protein P7_148 [Pectobacterium phage vB_PcaM_P7_Pc]